MAIKPTSRKGIDILYLFGWKKNERGAKTEPRLNKFINVAQFKIYDLIDYQHGASQLSELWARKHRYWNITFTIGNFLEECKKLEEPIKSIVMLFIIKKYQIRPYI